MVSLTCLKLDADASSNLQVSELWFVLHFACDKYTRSDILLILQCVRFPVVLKQLCKFVKLLTK